MKKSKKFVLISGVLVATLGMGTMAYNLNEGTLSNLIESKLVAYNYNKENALDNVFTQDGMTILPFIYKDSEQTISEEDIRDMFDKTGIRIQSISTDVIGTGTKIETEGKTYTILIYGDVDGDGYVDVFDAQKIIQHYVYEGDYELKGIYALAANVDNEDDEIDVFDAQRIVQFYVGYEQKLVVNEPISDKEKDKEKPIITLIGENPQKIKLGDKYIELGATVTDNMDNNVKVKIDSSKVKTDKVGTYIVTYNAKDASGNKADKVKRTVIVEDYIKDIEVIKPTKTEYQYGENIDLNGAKVRIKYASGDTKTIDMKEDMITGYNKNKVGIQEITVTYEGKTAKFSVNVLPQQQDYITGIEIKSPTKTNYKVGQTLDLTGAKFKTVMNSGAETSEQEITKEMIDVKTLDKVGTTTVTVSYETNNTIDDTTRVFTKTFTVQVVNYVSDIEITLLPNKLEYKYGQTIDTEGMVINAVMGDKTKKDITSQVSLDSKQLNEIGTTEVTVSYETDDTIDDTTKTFVKKFNIEVKNYVKDIELEKIPTITDYVEDQEIKKDGMILNSIKANGEKEKIDLEDKNIEITPIKAKYGSNTITITYKTDNTIDDTTKTFTKTFEISVVKKLKNIVVTKKQTTTNRYEEILIADVSSGLNEERISAEKLAVEIKDSKNNIVDDENIAKVTKTDSQFGGQVDLSFVATKAGKYTITPKVGTIVGDAIEVTVTENQIVNQIAVGDIGEKFRINQTRTVNVDFAHKYTEHGTTADINMEADRLTIETEGLEYTLRDSDDNVIDVSKKPKAIVKKISIKATETGNKELKIIVDKDDENAKYIKTESITILPEAEKELKIDNKNSNDIILYLQKPEGNTMVQKGNGDYIYTLLPVWIEDEDGVRTKVKLKDLIDGTVKVTNSFDDPNDPLQSIKTSGYKTNGNSVIEVTNTNDEIDYIAVGLLDEQAAEDLKGETMTISYKNTNINLTIKIQEKEIANIVVTKKQTTTNRYEETIIASISSGLNEERISAEKLAVEIKDSKNNIVDDENIAKVTKTDSQFGGQVDLSFVATKAGKYTITPKVGTIVGDAIEVTVTENQIVNQIAVGDIGEKFRINQTRTVNVDFAHKYTEHGTTADINMEADRLTIETEGLEYTLRDSDDNVIDVSKKPKAIVKKISIKATETGNKELKIIVDKDDENAKYIKTESITILPEAEKELKIDNKNSNDIILYLQKPEGNTMVQKGNGDYIYTLLPVWIEDEDGVRTKVKLKDLIDGTVKVTNSFDDPNDPLQSIKTSGYKTNGNSVIEVTNTNDEIDYIAVGLLDEQAGEDLNNKVIKISYGQITKTISLNILVQN